MTNALHLFALAVGVVAVGCLSGDSAPSVFGDAVFRIQSADGVMIDVETLEDIESELPFGVVLPNIPADARFVSLSVIRPPTSIDAAAAERLTASRIFVEASDGSGLFQLDASIAGTMPTGELGTAVVIGSSPGTLVENSGGAALGWRSCDVGYLLAYDPNLLPSEDAIAIATSVDDSCD